MSIQEMINPLSIVLALSCLILIGLITWLLLKYNRVESSHQVELDQAEEEIKKAQFDNQRVLDEAEEVVNLVCDVMLAFSDFIQEPKPEYLLGFDTSWDRLPEKLKIELGVIESRVHEQK